MSSYVQMLEKKGLAHPPQWLSSNIMYECVMGSVAYGVSNDFSDCDVYGFTIPKKDMVFPHLQPGYIEGFGRQIKRFEQYQESHIKDVGAEKEYDLTIYNIIKYFQLLMDNNPNMVDSLFVPADCIIHCSQVGNMVRDQRRLFLHKGCWHKLKGYAHSQIHKASTKEPIGKRKETKERFGWDVKFGYHCVRLMDEAEQILAYGDLDLRRNSEQLKAIRKGEMSEQEVLKWFSEKELQLEKLYNESKLPWGPPEDKIRQLLMDCLEHHYGTLENAYTAAPAAKKLKFKNFYSKDGKKGGDIELIGPNDFIDSIGRENVINLQALINCMTVYYWGE